VSILNKNTVAVVTATYRRPFELRRFLECLRSCPDVKLVSICDNFGCPETLNIINTENISSTYPILYKKAAYNGGCGAGLNLAIEQARGFLSDITHFWICDDDIYFEGNPLSPLLAAIEKSGAGSAAPAITDHSGLVVAAPMLDSQNGRWVKLGTRPDEFIKHFPAKIPLPFLVCMGTCHLVTAAAIEKVGKIREDFWMLGEDLNFAHRIVAHGGGGVFVPWVYVEHLYGSPLDPSSAQRSEYFKHLALLQNLTFMAYKTPYAKYARGRYFDCLRGKGLMPNYAKFLKKFHWKIFAIIDLLTVIFAAWCIGQPAGGNIAQRIRKKRMLQSAKVFS